jgi:serine protease AprX
MTHNRPLALALVLVVLLSAASGVVSGTVPESRADVLGEASDVSLQSSASEGSDTTLVVRLTDVNPAVVDAAAEKQATLVSHAATTQTSVRKYAERHDGVSVANSLWLTNAVLVEVTDPSDPKTVVTDLTALSDVESVHPNYVYTVELEPVTPTGTPSGVPTVADVDATSGLAAIGAPAAWETFDTRGAGVRVAVLDTGVDATHPDIDLYTTDPSDPTYPGGWTEFNAIGLAVDGSTPTDSHGHGTHVSGTLVGGDDSGTAIGVAPDATLLVGKVLGDDGTATFFQVVAGMQWAVESDADVLSMSLGSTGHHSEFVRPVRTAEAAGVVVVAASGNDGPKRTVSPGNVFEVISVGAVDDDGVVAEFSGNEEIETRAAWGDAASAAWPETYPVPRVAAPGVDVQSSLPGGEYGTASGTSMATPHVAGTVALMLAAAERPLSPAEVRDTLAETAENPEARVGAGTVNTQTAVEVATGPAGQTDPNEPNDDPSTATLVADTPAQGLVSGSADDDWFRVESDGTPVAVGFERTGGTGTLQVSLVAPSAAEWSLTDPTVEVGPDESVGGTVDLPAGTYFVRVESGVDGGTGGYELSVLPVETETDATEPNDAANAATSLTPGETVEATITPTGDVDFYRLDVDEGDTVVVDVRFSDERGDLDLGLYGADGTLLDQSISTSDEEQVTFVVDEEGTLYVTVVGFVGATGPYTIVATVTPVSSQSSVAT